METTDEFEHFQCFDVKQFSCKKNTFFKKLEYLFLVESTTIKVQHFHTKLPSQSHIGWGVQNGPFEKNTENSFNFLKILLEFKNLL